MADGDGLSQSLGKLGQAAAALRELTTPRPLNFPDLSRIKTPFQANYASEFHAHLTREIARFEAELDETHEVGLRLVSFGQAVTFHLQGMGYMNPSLITFNGLTDGGDVVELIQHVSQISLLLMKLPRLDPTRPARRLGIPTAEELTAKPTGT
jgi:hypothetical protein